MDNIKLLIDNMRLSELNGIESKIDYRDIEKIYIDSIITDDDTNLKKIYPVIEKLLVKYKVDKTT